MASTLRPLLLGGLLAFLVACASSESQEPALHAIVERDGTVVLCLSRGEMLFSDRCTGRAELVIVQPIKPGPVVWETAIGTIEMKSDPPGNPACALSHASWDPKTERTIPTGKNITKLTPATVLAHLREAAQRGHGEALEAVAEGIATGFALDLDNDGSDEIVFSSDNVQIAAGRWEKLDKPAPYQVVGGILTANSFFPWAFYDEAGEYRGATDAIGHVTIKGIAPIAPATGEIELLVRSGNMFNPNQDLIRFKNRQRLETILFRCF